MDNAFVVHLAIRTHALPELDLMHRFFLSRLFRDPEATHRAETEWRPSAHSRRARRPSVAAAHAEPPALDPAHSGDAALQRIGLGCLDHMLRNEPAVLAGIDDGIHQMRVAVRRLRATLSAFGRLLPENQRQWASEELRWLADALGPARNLDVFETALLKPAGPDVGASPAALEKLA